MNITYCLTHPYRLILKVIDWIIYKPQFKEYYFTNNIKSTRLMTPRYISLGNKCSIGNNARIEGVYCYNNVNFTPHIEIQDGVSIEQNIHLTCANKVIIGANTAIAANVTITDIDHPYTDIHVPVEKQNIIVKDVSIGEDCKIYNGAVILQNVHIGKHCVIGANSVVNKDIPDYCVVVGAPARIIKRYDFDLKLWRKTNPDGSFI